MINDSKESGWWSLHRCRLLKIVAALMATAALLKLGMEFHRLVWESGPTGGVDLKHLHRWVAGWFSGQPDYQQSNAAQYPPATYIMLWPLIGWISFSSARWFWAVTSLGALAVIISLAVRISGARTRPEQTFVALLLLSINGTGVAIGSGQLILHLLPALLGSVLILERKPETWGADLVAAGLLTWAMIKPSVAAPLLLAVLLSCGRWRPALLLLLMYAGLTLAAAAFQTQDLLGLLKSCLAKASAATTQFPATRNVHALLVAVGLEKWMILSSSVIFVALGTWLYRYRAADRWVLIGVAGLVARMWTYHRSYDDVLILLPELALCRIAMESSSPGRRGLAEKLLVLCALAMLCPARFLDRLEWVWAWKWIWIFAGSHAILWLVVLAYLVNYVRHEGDPSHKAAAACL